MHSYVLQFLIVLLFAAFSVLIHSAAAVFVLGSVWLHTPSCLCFSMDGFRVVKLDDVLPLLDILVTSQVGGGG